MAGHRDPAALDPEARFARAFQELLELTWAEHRALADQLEQLLSMERQLMEVWRIVEGQRADRLATGEDSREDAAGQGQGPQTATHPPEDGDGAPKGPDGAKEDPVLTDLPGVGKIRAKALKDAGYDLARLAEATPEALAEVRGISPSGARELIEAAQALQGQGP